MVDLIRTLLAMSLPRRLITLRKERGLTQQKMADMVGIHVNSLKKYESEQAQPSLDALKKIALALHVSTDFLLFDEHEREPDDELKRQFEAVAQMSPEDRQAIKTLLDGMIIKHQTSQMIGNLRT